ncbi:MAG: DNA repair protein RadA [Gammaproteobacteria bacterium]|nr:DNA repair protein RadA [Gammaproteobacteria bacterium]
MARVKTVFVCSACGGVAPKWAGQCGDCGEWNTLVENVAGANKRDRAGGYAGDSRVLALADSDAVARPRLATGIGEFDRVLGGGLVPGSVSLIGGDPGIGKSTLLLQVVAALSSATNCLYVSGEESLEQIGMRAKRIGVADAAITLCAETRVESIVATATTSKPGVLVIDSVQTMYSADLPSAPGTVAQLRECAAQLVRFAKGSGAAIFLVGHVTKEGVIAGPRVLEHMVDTVLYFESDAGSRYRIIRAAKNRFGAAHEIGVFAMTDTGVRAVSNPSSIFLSHDREAAAGSCVLVTREGSRPLLVEVQALACDNPSGNPRRVAVGYEQNRLAMLLAVMQRHAGVVLAGQDVFVNIVGGVRITETAADLPILLAVMSSFRDRPIPAPVLAFGEIGLAGEIRPVPYGEERVAAAAKQGFKRAIVPLANRPKKPVEGIEVLGVKRLLDAIDALS